MRFRSVVSFFFELFGRFFVCYPAQKFVPTTLCRSRSPKPSVRATAGARGVQSRYSRGVRPKVSKGCLQGAEACGMVANVACAGIVFLTSHAHKSEEVTLRSGGQLCASCASISVIFCACTGKQRARLVICSSKHPFAFTPLSRSSSTNTQAHTLQTLSLPAAGENLRPATAARLQSCWHFGIFDPSSFTTFPNRASGAKFKLRTLAQQRVPAARTAAFSSLSPRGQGFCFSEPTPRLPPMPRCGTIAFQLHISYAHRNHDRICAGTIFGSTARSSS